MSLYIKFGFVIAIFGMILMTGSMSSAVTLTIDAQSNIYGAGHTTAPNPGGWGGGILPPSYSFTADSNQVLAFSDVSGLVSYNNGGNYWGADGVPGWDYGADMSSYNGISGIKYGGSFYLVGVFLTDSEPSGTAPATLDFGPSGYGTNFSSLAPEINQLFFIGDGLTGTGSGSIQQFYIPESATRLFLGFVDGYDFQGLPGDYQDNIGSLTATFDITSTDKDNDRNHHSVPEPSTLLLLGSGMTGFVLTRIKRIEDFWKKG